MPEIRTMHPDAADSESNTGDNALSSALSRLLVPLARLCLSSGITFAAAEELLKQAFVQEANALQPGAPEHGMVSRISTVTGINRREVTRLTKLKTDGRMAKQPLAAEILARWTTDSAFLNTDGSPMALNRLGQTPSFETLAQSITRDIHPRSMLDELIRLGLASHDEQLDLISLIHADFVPAHDSRQMLSFLGDNVGDHLQAAIDNTLHNGNRHLEQAVFADELSSESIQAVSPLIMDHWQALRADLVPAITKLIEADRHAGRVQDKRIRIGLYTFSDTTADTAEPPKARINRRFRKSSPKENTQ